LDLELRSVAQLHGGTFRRIEDSFQFVSPVNEAGPQAVFLLALEARLQLIKGAASKVRSQLIVAILRQGTLQRLPGGAVIAHDGIFGGVFQLARLGVFRRELHIQRRLGGTGCQGAQQNLGSIGGGKQREQQKDQAPTILPKTHFPLPICSSLPSTTPEATEMAALSESGSSARAISRLMRASTVLRPLGSTSMKVTMVPSGSELPEQSFTGSVSTTMARSVRWALMRKLQASAATCCTTRRTEASSSLAPGRLATNCAAPCVLPEFMRVQAMPFFVVTARLALCLPPTERSNLTSLGAKTRLSY